MTAVPRACQVSRCPCTASAAVTKESAGACIRHATAGGWCPHYNHLWLPWERERGGHTGRSALCSPRVCALRQACNARDQCYTCWPGMGCEPLKDYNRLVVREHGRLHGRHAMKAEVWPCRVLGPVPHNTLPDLRTTASRSAPAPACRAAETNGDGDRRFAARAWIEHRTA